MREKTLIEMRNRITTIEKVVMAILLRLEKLEEKESE